MKTIIALITILSMPCFAENVSENWFPVGKADAKTNYSTKAVCETAEGQDCFLVSKFVDGSQTINKDARFHDVQTAMVDDLQKPIYKPPYNTANCDSAEDCQSDVGTIQAGCTTGDQVQYEKNAVLPGWTIYCTGISGYEQKEEKTLVENSTNKTTVEAADAAALQLETDISDMQKHIAFGTRMIAYIGARNKAKTPALTTAQVKTIVETYETIHALLASGSLTTAKEEITALTVNDPLVTQADKDAILGEINAYLGL